MKTDCLDNSPSNGHHGNIAAAAAAAAALDDDEEAEDAKEDRRHVHMTAWFWKGTP